MQYKIGDLIEVIWLDACLRSNERMSDCVPLKARSIGIVIKKTKRYIIIQHSTYLDETEPEMDTITIPLGWFDKVKVIKKDYD